MSFKLYVDLIDFLHDRGLVLAAPERNRVTISLPKQGIDEPTLNRLRNLVSSKSTVLKAALEATDLRIDVDEEKIHFPWFTKHDIEGEIEAYTQLVVALVKTAKKLKYVSEVERPPENLKYTMRLFLVRLGFIGDEYKVARKILTRNLEGNSSWKTGHTSSVRSANNFWMPPPGRFKHI